MFLYFLLIVAIFSFPGPVHAYIDPGAGSYLIQILIGTALGGAYLVKNFWKNIIAFVKNLFKKKPSE